MPLSKHHTSNLPAIAALLGITLLLGLFVSSVAISQDNGGAYKLGPGDQLIITPREIVPTTIRTYGDHRMAMSFGLLRLIARDIDIENPAVVSKTWPGYWGMLDRLDN